jgi:hypothetical protein
MIMNTGLKYSLIFHLFVIVTSFIYVSKVNEFSSTERIITVDLVNIKPAASTNLKNSPIRKKNKISKENILTSAKAPIVKVTKKIKHAKTNPIVVPKPKANKLVHAAKEASQAKANKEMEKLLDDLEKNFPSEDLSNASANNKKKSGKKNPAMSDRPYDKSLPLTMAEQDNIKMQIERKFFNPIVSDFNVGEIIIKIKLDMQKNGELGKIIVLNSSSYTRKHSDAFVALKDSLVRAVHMASPLHGLDESRYEGRNGWKEIELVFDAYYLMHA